MLTFQRYLFFVGAVSMWSLSPPLPSSLSITESPRSAAWGDTTTEPIHHPESIVVDGVNGKDESLCWVSASECGSVSGLSVRLPAQCERSLLMKTGTMSECTPQHAGNTIEIAGEGKALSILESSQVDSLLSMSSETVSIEDVGFTQHSLLLSRYRLESLLILI
ncbi:hypothetical protein BLNAU_22820 [Blattamonas nauphoetae]|uniref:Uncharacterized protein n=1 Tax=Blattamonas nauphoetae TaxID=2049346 RepID=A0ABQ9WUZ4_9EUKA|nr:hypothetical protein BLNAU_22820 [Blattamonas nauphoetae]